MSASLQRDYGRTPAQASPSQEDSRATGEYIVHLETPRTLPNYTAFDCNSNKPKIRLSSPNPNDMGSLGQGMPAAMKPRSHAKHEVELTELSGLSDEEDNEEAPANYVLSASKQERFSNFASYRTYSSSNTPPVKATLKAREMSTSLDVDQAPCFSPRNEFEFLQSMQIAGCEPRIRPWDDQDLILPSAIKGFHNLPDLAQPLNEGDEDLSTSDPNRRSRTPSASEDEKFSSIHGEIRKPPTRQPGLPTASDEMKGRLKQECCIGIGSWSKDDIPPIDRAPSNAMEEEIGPVPSEIYAIFDKNWLGDATQCPNGQRRQQPSTPPDSQARGTAGPSSSTFDARTYGTFLREEPDDDESDDDLPKRRGRKAGPRDGDGEANGPRLACPFNKHDPYFFKANIINGPTFRCCAGPGFEDIARIKAHLYRLHKTPINCPRCGMLFNAQELLIEHLQSATCDIKTFVPLRSITDEIEKKLKSRKKSNLGPAERWKEIYRLIFPNEPVPSPYYEPTDTVSPSMSEFLDTEDHETFAYRELPRAFREALDITFQGQLPQSPEEFKGLLVSRLSDCLEQVSSRYHNSQQASIQSNFGPDTATMSTPKASSNDFHPLANVPNQHYNALNVSGTRSTAPVSWYQPYEVPNTAYHQLPYTQEGQNSRVGSIDLPNSRSRDSGYSTNSVCCFPNCIEYCSCYDSSDVNRSSLDGNTQAANFPDALGLQQNLEETTMDPARMQNNVLTLIPRTNGNLDNVDFLQLL